MFSYARVSQRPRTCAAELSRKLVIYPRNICAVAERRGVRDCERVTIVRCGPTTRTVIDSIREPFAGSLWCWMCWRAKRPKTPSLGIVVIALLVKDATKNTLSIEIHFYQLFIVLEHAIQDNFFNALWDWRCVFLYRGWTTDILSDELFSNTLYNTQTSVGKNTHHS